MNTSHSLKKVSTPCQNCDDDTAAVTAAAVVVVMVVLLLAAAADNGGDGCVSAADAVLFCFGSQTFLRRFP